MALSLCFHHNQTWLFPENFQEQTFKKTTCWRNLMVTANTCKCDPDSRFLVFHDPGGLKRQDHLGVPQRNTQFQTSQSNVAL